MKEPLPELRAGLLANLARAAFYAAPPERTAARRLEALALARRVDNPEILATVLQELQYAIFDLDHVAERDEAAGEILALGRRLGRKDLEVVAHWPHRSPNR